MRKMFRDFSVCRYSDISLTEIFFQPNATALETWKYSATKVLSMVCWLSGSAHVSPNLPHSRTSNNFIPIFFTNSVCWDSFGAILILFLNNSTILMQLKHKISLSTFFSISFWVWIGIWDKGYFSFQIWIKLRLMVHSPFKIWIEKRGVCVFYAVNHPCTVTVLLDETFHIWGSLYP